MAEMAENAGGAHEAKETGGKIVEMAGTPTSSEELHAAPPEKRMRVEGNQDQPSTSYMFMSGLISALKDKPDGEEEEEDIMDFFGGDDDYGGDGDGGDDEDDDDDDGEEKRGYMYQSSDEDSSTDVELPSEDFVSPSITSSDDEEDNTYSSSGPRILTDDYLLSGLIASGVKEHGAYPRKRVQRQKHEGVDPASDDDPIEPGHYQQPQYRKDRRGWTRELTTIPVHEFEGRKPYGPAFERPEDDDPLKYFLKFFPLDLFKKMARWTNINGGANPRFGKKTTPEEVKAWFGIRMIQGVHSNSNADDDWSTRDSLMNPKIKRTMMKNRFSMLSEVLACANPFKGPQQIRDKQNRNLYMKNHPLYRLQHIWDTVNKLCLDNYNPCKELTLDEATTKYKGGKSGVKRFFLPLKPGRIGFKIHAICDPNTGYTLHMMVHSESNKNMKDVVMKTMDPFVGRYHQLYCSKSYTSPGLASELLEKRTYMCGAVRRVSKGLPDDFSTNPVVNPTRYRHMEMMAKTPRGTIYSRQKGQQTVVLWRDTKILTFLSTCHQGFRNQATDFLPRNIREKGEKKSSQKEVRAPPHAMDYNQFIGGVDKADQLRGYHTCSRQSMAWWKKIMYFLVDVARVNAWICYKANVKAQPRVVPLTHRLFTVEIAEKLIAGFSEGSTRCHQQLELAPVPSINGPIHQSIRMPVKAAKMCVQCRRKGRTTTKGHHVTTRSGCTSCNIHLCRGKCFLEFHTAE
ncbi:piggyBac transposable element-derived protein 4-like [Patiria miniata]|uniref:PiggyBac transposable element-derived protein domain-containing protein n=1 Tax=Patiria miniata TaxID=46514 RepID=A0A914BU27_PATMI|nr:piggyBac transposable element-derived protein 4-like [Patiria miniata]